MTSIAAENLARLKDMARAGVFRDLDPALIKPNAAWVFCGDKAQAKALNAFQGWCNEHSIAIDLCGWFGGALCLPADSPVVREARVPMLDLMVMDQLRTAKEEKGARQAIVSTHWGCAADTGANITIQEQLYWLLKASQRVVKDAPGMPAINLFWDCRCPFHLTGENAGVPCEPHLEIVLVSERGFSKWNDHSA